jgi:hypothetical protein
MRGMALRKTFRRGVPTTTRPKVLQPDDVAGRAAAPVLAKLTASQVIDEIGRRLEAAAGNAYTMAVCLRELSRPERYRRELGFASFEELLAAHPFLPTRMTAFKWFTVVGAFGEDEVRRVGGMEKSYLLIRASRRLDPKADPRKLLATGARVGGVRATATSARMLREVLRKIGQRRKRPDTKVAKSAARRLRNAFRRISVTAAIRVHVHQSLACVATHLGETSAARLVEYLREARRARVGVT